MNQESNIRLEPKKGQQLEEINIAEIFLFLWKKKWWLAIISSIFSGIGIGIAFKVEEVFSSDAIITIRDANRGTMSSAISQLGSGLGSMIASQIGGKNNDLEILELTTKGRKLAKQVIINHDLLPELYPKLWDNESKRWKVNDSNEIPNITAATELLRNKIMTIKKEQTFNVISIGANTYNALFSKKIIELYLLELEKQIKSEVKLESEENVEYLESQLKMISNPMLQEKIHSLIASELEKAMLVSSRPFLVIEPPIAPTVRSKPNRKFIIGVTTILGILISLSFVVLQQYFHNLKKEIKAIST